MAPVEMSIYHSDDEEPVVTTVNPGRSEIDLTLGPATLVVDCKDDDTRGRLQVGGDSDHIEVVKYMDEEDENGQVIIDPKTTPVEFSGDQLIEIISDIHPQSIFLYHSKPSETQETTSGQVSLPIRELVPIK